MKTFILGFIYSYNPFNSYTILGKGKYNSHTIACLIIYTHAFCHICDENFLKQGFLNSGKGWVVIENFAGGDFFTRWWEPAKEWFWWFEPFTKLKTAFCEYWVSIKIKISMSWVPKSTKLKQEWCKSNDYS